MYFYDSEYYIVYSNAVHLLLNIYNVETEADINKFFSTHIPVPEGNKSFAEDKSQFANLKDEDLNIRIKASKYFRNKALQETSGFRAMLFQRPDTFEKLFNALKKEKDIKVIVNLIIALGGAYDRYFEHFRVYENLSPFFNHASSEVKYYTIIWTRRIENKEKLKTLKSMLLQKQSKKIQKILMECITEIEEENNG